MFNDLLRHRSGRVIALARAVLAATFLFAIWIDPSQPASHATVTYAALVAYVLIAVGLTALTWNNWWADAKLAAPAHVLDIVMFTLLVLTSDGYTSPFFVFFVFLILSAAIRWGWRETALTAGPVTLLYIGAGLAAGASPGTDFDLQRFIIRSGNLVTLSAILIWFGVNQGFSGLRLPRKQLFGDPSPDDPPLRTAVEVAMRIVDARRAVLVWREAGAQHGTAIGIAENGFRTLDVGYATFGPKQDRPTLFDIPRDRALLRDSRTHMAFLKASSFVPCDIATEFGIEDGLALPIRTEAGEGKLLLGQAAGLCIDHLEFGDYLARSIERFIERYALLAAVEDSATARARLSLSRDLHDSIVQFLAGATFKVEAMSRSAKAGGAVDGDLRELKELLLEEQRELRSSIGALRNNSVALPALAGDLDALCKRLARQWDVQCRFDADVPDLAAPMRLHLDTHQLVREAIANAVRHARTKSVQVALSTDSEDLLLEISNDGDLGERARKDSPWSLRERVEEANGTLMLASREGRTTVSVRLPLNNERMA